MRAVLTAIACVDRTNTTPFQCQQKPLDFFRSPSFVRVIVNNVVEKTRYPHLYPYVLLSTGTRCLYLTANLALAA